MKIIATEAVCVGGPFDGALVPYAHGDLCRIMRKVISAAAGPLEFCSLQLAVETVQYEVMLLAGDEEGEVTPIWRWPALSPSEVIKQLAGGYKKGAI